MVFTANAGLVWQGRFIVSNFRHEVRRPESPYHETWFSDQGYEIRHLPEGFYFEGEGDLLRCGNSWFAGYHIRSDIQSHQKMAEILEQEILSLELVSDWFYHLDTCFCPLGDGKALFCPKAFDAYARRVLEHHIADLIAVSPSDARRFACNAVVGDKKIVMNAGCRQTRQRLEQAGFEVLETPLDEFIKAGGSAKCLVLNLDLGGPTADYYRVQNLVNRK
jgi:N-dimethylarginine dimethylaminohydrolase